MNASTLIRGGERVECPPCGRHVLSQQAWFAMAHALHAEPGLAFVALWADAGQVHALFQDGGPLLASVAVEAGLYTALSPARPGAALFERAVSDLWGHQAADAADTRPWLDHGVWPMLRPLSDRPVPNAAAPEGAEPEVPEMLAAGSESGVDSVPYGPLPPGPAGASHWHATVQGGAVLALEARLGWGHRGVLGLMRGRSAVGAARIAARIDGAATVAHSTAFARAVEAALGFTAPQAALGLRGLMLAVERVAVGLHDLHAVADALGRPFGPAAAGRAALLEACGLVFGHRLMMDCVKPGGVVPEPGAEALMALDAVLAGLPGLRRAWPGGGALSLPDALALGVPGAAGRASGRVDPGVPGAAVSTAGDLGARMTLLSQSVERDIEAARTHLANLPVGPGSGILPHANSEGLAMAHGPHGPVWHWVRLAGGTVAASFSAGPGWLHLPALEAGARGIAAAAIPAHVASFGFRPAGMDL